MRCLTSCLPPQPKQPCIIFENEAYGYWSNLQSWSDRNGTRKPIGDGYIKITWISGGGFLIERATPFGREDSMRGEFVSSNCKKTYDPVEFVLLLNGCTGLSLLKPLLDTFDAHAQRKETALRIMDDEANNHEGVDA